LSVLAVARLVVAHELRQRWRTFLAVGVVAGLVFAVAQSAAIGARRTHTAALRLAAAVDAPDVTLRYFGLTDPRAPTPALVDPALVEAVEPFVTAVGRDLATWDWFYPQVFFEPPPPDRFALREGRLSTAEPPTRWSCRSRPPGGTPWAPQSISPPTPPTSSSS
jgi:hypothetical protein